MVNENSECIGTDDEKMLIGKFKTQKECAYACKDIRIGSRVSRWFTFGAYTDDPTYSAGCKNKDDDGVSLCDCYCETVDECSEKEKHDFNLFMYTPHPAGKCGRDVYQEFCLVYLLIVDEFKILASLWFYFQIE